jgi:hypothetical protein
MKFASASMERPLDVCDNPVLIIIGNRFRIIGSFPHSNRVIALDPDSVPYACPLIAAVPGLRPGPAPECAYTRWPAYGPS